MDGALAEHGSSAHRSLKEVSIPRPAAWLTVIAIAIAIAIVTLSLLLAACRSPFATPAPLPERALQISVLTSDGQDPNAIAAGQAVVDFLFDSDPATDERVSCAGTVLGQVTANTGRNYFQGTLAVSAGRPYACTYTGQGQTVDLTLAAAQPLLLTTPTSGSIISRHDPLTLTFSGGQPGSSISVNGGAQKDAPAFVPPANALVHLAQGSNSGSLTLPPSLLDTLRAGDGFLAMYQSYTTPLDGTPFKSAQVDYATTTGVALTWS